MRFHGLDLNLLVVLDVLLTEQSITRAAERLHRTQPAVSAALKRLRDYFDDDLFVMNGRALMPTPKALTLAQPVRVALAQIKSGVIGEDGFDPAQSDRTFRMIMSDYMAAVFFDKVVSAVADIAPQVRFQLIQFDDDFDGPLNRGEVDFLMFPSTYLSDRHPTCPLFEEEMVAVRCAKSAHKALDFDSYFAGAHVAARFGKTRKPAIEELLLSDLGLRRTVAVEVPNFSLTAHVLTGTQRIATMHRRLADLIAPIKDLRIDPLPVNLPPVVEALQWPLVNNKDPASVWLRGVIEEAARDMTDLAEGKT